MMNLFLNKSYKDDMGNTEKDVCYELIHWSDLFGSNNYSVLLLYVTFDLLAQ